MKNSIVAIAVVAAIAAGGIGFYGGMTYQKSKTPALTGRLGAGQGTFGNGQNRQAGSRANGFQPIAGEIISGDEKSITVKMTDGTSKIIFLSDSTQINKASLASKSDLAVGEKVAVFGQTNSDGSVTAQNIQLNPQDRGQIGGDGNSAPVRTIEQ